MVMAIPVIPTLPAGYTATAADFNNLAYAATFLLTKPMTRIHDGAGGQSLAVLGTAISFNTADYDTDTMWNSNYPTELVVQTPGFYKFDYMVDQNSNISMNTALQITTGIDNPAGPNIITLCWAGYGYGVARVCCRASGVIPFYLYELDLIQVMAYPNTTGATTYSNASQFTQSYLSVELVSI